MSRDNTALLLMGGLLLVGAGRGLTSRKKGYIIWNGWCDNNIFGECYDYDFNVTVRFPFYDGSGKEHYYQVNSTQALRYDYDAQNSGAWEYVMNATLQYAEDKRQELIDQIGSDNINIPAFDTLDWQNEYTKGWDDAQEGFDITSYKTEIKELVKVWLCYQYPATCPLIEVA